MSVLEAPPAAARRPWRVRAALFAITCYQASRLSPTGCRFYPSCSAYAAEAISAHGVFRGTRLAARRLARCHPFGDHGIDLVPLPTEHRRGSR